MRTRSALLDSLRMASQESLCFPSLDFQHNLLTQPNRVLVRHQPRSQRRFSVSLCPCVRNVPKSTDTHLRCPQHVPIFQRLVGVSTMLQDHTETEYHLTPHGWLKGSFWVYGTKTEDVPAPSVRVETWVEEIDDPLGGAPPAVSWRRVWESDSATQEAKAELRQRFPRPEYRPLEKP
jgi:hypothetical protein